MTKSDGRTRGEDIFWLQMSVKQLKARLERLEYYVTEAPNMTRQFHDDVTVTTATAFNNFFSELRDKIASDGFNG